MPAPPARGGRRLWPEREAGGGQGCGALLTAFVHRIPRDDRVLMGLPAIEFDTAARTLRRWPLPGESGFFEVVGGVVGDEIIVSYAKAGESTRALGLTATT